MELEPPQDGAPAWHGNSRRDCRNSDVQRLPVQLLPRGSQDDPAEPPELLPQTGEAILQRPPAGTDSPLGQAGRNRGPVRLPPEPGGILGVSRLDLREPGYNDSRNTEAQAPRIRGREEYRCPAVDALLRHARDGS